MTDIVIAAAGTGGHIYPGVAVAEKLKELNPKIEIHFLGSPEGLESKIIPPLGFPLTLLPARKFVGVSFMKKVLFFLCLPWSIIKSFSFFLTHRPHACFGTGAYASIIPLKVAKWMRIPIFIHESNAYPGMSNRILAWGAKKIFLHFKESEKYLHGHHFEVVGTPVREKFSNQNQSVDLPESTGESLRVAILGGSQGARALNEFVIKNRESLFSSGKFAILHQTGVQHLNSVLEIHSSCNDQIKRTWKPIDFIHNVNAVYKWADLFLCRAGSSTLAELIRYEMPSILVPFPFATHQHQLHNAKSFESHKMALLIEEKNIDSELWPKLQSLNRGQIASMKAAIQTFKKSHPLFEKNASDRIAHVLLETI